MTNMFVLISRCCQDEEDETDHRVRDIDHAEEVKRRFEHFQSDTERSFFPSGQKGSKSSWYRGISCSVQANQSSVTSPPHLEEPLAFSRGMKIWVPSNPDSNLTDSRDVEGHGVWCFSAWVWSTGEFIPHGEADPVAMSGRSGTSSCPGEGLAPPRDGRFQSRNADSVRNRLRPPSPRRYHRGGR
jgi:hypothetical protein